MFGLDERVVLNVDCPQTPSCICMLGVELKAENSSGVFDARLPLEDGGVCVQSNDSEYNSDMEAEMEDKMEALKTELSQAEDDDEEEGDDSDANLPTRRKTRQSMKGAVDSKRQANERYVPNAQGKSIRKVESVTASHGAPVAFGRLLAPFFGPPSPLSPEQKPGSAVLVLDHAERVFTLSANQKAESNNFLVQLLLLPQVMRLNLTVIIVSRSSLLEYSRECIWSLVVTLH